MANKTHPRDHVIKPKNKRTKKPESRPLSKTVTSTVKTKTVKQIRSSHTGLQDLQEQLAQREAELEIINSIQQGLAAELDFQAIVDLVGDKLSEVLHTGDLGIRWYDEKNNLIHFLYDFEPGEMLTVQPTTPPSGSAFETILKTRQPVVWNKQTEYPSGNALPGTDRSKSLASIPIISSDRVLGVIQIENYERENAFGETELRLLTTIAASLGTALENARLFDETQRLLKETEQRNAELALINSVQTGLVAKMDIQGIYDLVGDKIRDIFDAQVVDISVYQASSDLIVHPYLIERGMRLTVESSPLMGFRKHVIETRQHLLINENHNEAATYYGNPIAIVGEAPKSTLFVPMVVGDESKGVISLQNLDRENAFSDSDVRLLTTLANSMSVALENARLFDETQRLLKETEQRNAELAIINSVQEGLASKLDMQAIYDLVGDKIRDIFDAQVVDIAMYDPATGLISWRYGIEKGERFYLEPRPLLGFRKHVIETRQYLLINENTIEAAARYRNPIALQGDVPKSALFVPMIVGDEAKGVISLQNLDREHVFSESDVRLLQTLANSMSVALENARLFDETQRLLKETEQRNAELAIINSVQEALAAQLDIHGVFNVVGDKLRDIFNYQDVTIYYGNLNTRTVTVEYSFVKGQKLEPQNVPINSMYEYFLASNETFVFNGDLPSFAAKFSDYRNPEPPKSLLAVPVRRNKDTDPVIYLTLQDWEGKKIFSESDVRLLQTLANSMSVALENARLFDETQRLLKETEQRNAELAIINSVQEGLASKMDMQAIYDLVGDKIRDIFDAQSLLIVSYDLIDEMQHFNYAFEKGERQYPPLAPLSKFAQHIIHTRELLVINEDFEHRGPEVGMNLVPGTEQPKSGIWVPLMTGDAVRGIISIQNVDHENAFSESDVRLLQTLANSMSVALENARLFDETQQRANELAIINSVQAALAANLEMQSMYQLVGEKVREAFDAQVVTLVEYDPQNNSCSWRYAVEKGETLNIEPSVPVGFSKYVIENRQMLLVNENLDERRRELCGSVAAGNPAKSYLGVPLLINNQVRGVISLQNVDREHAFTESDVRLLTTLANSMSVALENARLFDETNKRAGELATINTVSSALASELDIDPLIQLVGEQTRTTFKADIAYVALLDEVNNTINFPYTYGEKLSTMRYGEGLTSKIIETGQPLLLNSDVTEQTQQIGATIVGIQSLSYLGVPIMMGGKAVGVVSVQSTSQENAFDEADQRLLSTIAANVGSALHNAQLYKEAQESRAAAERANRAKSTFLANMSHELRTPLNAIIGFTRIVRKKSNGLLPEKQLENLDKVLTSSEHLLSLINTVLDIAKIEAGRMDVIPGNFSIGALADQCVNLVMPLLKPKVILEKQMDANLGIIYSDQDKIKQIMLNLLSNAAKFTHEGEITLRLEKCDEDNLRISVADSGIGISQEALVRIFDEFQQADTSTTRRYGGSGLGLAISRNLARLLGGDLTATSELGNGSTFSLTIPMYYGRKTTARPDSKSDSVQSTESYSQADSAKKRVLVIDDDPDAAYLLQESLSQNEFAIIGTPNGHAGLQLAREKQPDAILLDILMPETDGWQVLNDLKMDKATVDIPVILLTIVDKKALGFKLGAAAYLLKPLNPAVVLEALRRVIGEKEHPHKHVLVVDDDPNIAEMLRQTLPESDFVLASAEDGEAGLLAIEAQRPDVILLDLMMPKLDGFGVIERLRADPELRNIPIIVISAKELTEDESKTLKESVAFVMKKQGFNSDVLMQEINSVVKK